jgi:hypothetical protein
MNGRKNGIKIGKHEQAWRPTKEELETINVANEEIKRELKIRTLITPKERDELVTLRLYRCFCLVL